MELSNRRRVEWVPLEPTTPQITWKKPVERSAPSHRSEKLDAAITKSPEAFQEALREQGELIARNTMLRALEKGEEYKYRTKNADSVGIVKWEALGGTTVYDEMWRGTETYQSPVTPGVTPPEADLLWRKALPGFVDKGSNLHYYPPSRAELESKTPRRKAYLQIDPTHPDSPRFIKALIARAEAGAFQPYQAKIHVQTFAEDLRPGEIQSANSYHNLSCWYFATDVEFQRFLREVARLEQEWSLKGKHVLRHVPDNKYLTHGHALTGAVLFGKDASTTRSFDQMRSDVLAEVALAAEEKPTVEHVGQAFVKRYQQYFPGRRPGSWLNL